MHARRFDAESGLSRLGELVRLTAAPAGRTEICEQGIAVTAAALGAESGLLALREGGTIVRGAIWHPELCRILDAAAREALEDGDPVSEWSAPEGSVGRRGKQKLDELNDSLKKWEETTLKKALNSLPERSEEFITTSSEPINRLYTPLDVADLDYSADLGLPGEYPFTRGVHPTLHRSRLCTMRMFAGFGTAEERNARFKYLLEQGQTGLSIA